MEVNRMPDTVTRSIHDYWTLFLFEGVAKVLDAPCNLLSRLTHFVLPAMERTSIFVIKTSVTVHRSYKNGLFEICWLGCRNIASGTRKYSSVTDHKNLSSTH